MGTDLGTPLPPGSQAREPMPDNPDGPLMGWGGVGPIGRNGFHGIPLDLGRLAHCRR
jgi:hypothetical protein